MGNLKNNLFNFKEPKSMRSIFKNFDQVLNQIGQISKFRFDYKIIEKHLIELANDLPHKLMAIRKQFNLLSSGSKQVLLEQIINKIRINNPGDRDLLLDVTKIQNFDDEDLVNLIKYCKNYLKRQLYKVVSKDIELRVAKITELQQQIPEFHSESSEIITAILATEDIDNLRKIILEQEDPYADTGAKNTKKINAVLVFCTEENNDCQEKIEKYTVQLQELKDLQIKEEQEKNELQHKLQGISTALEEMKIRDNLLEKEIHALQDNANADIEKLNVVKTKLLEWKALRVDINDSIIDKESILKSLKLTSNSLERITRDVSVLNNKISCLSKIMSTNQELMQNSKDNGIQKPGSTVRVIFENVLIKALTSEDSLLFWKMQDDAERAAKLGTFFSVNSDKHNAQNIEFVERSGVCKKPSRSEPTFKHTLTSLRSSIIDATIEKHLSCLTEDITFCMYDKIDRKLIHVPDLKVRGKDTETHDQHLRGSISSNPLEPVKQVEPVESVESDSRMYDNPLFEFQEVRDGLDRTTFITKVQSFTEYAEQTTSLRGLQKEKKDLEVEALSRNQDDIAKTETVSELLDTKSHESLMASLADIEVDVQENLENAKNMADLILLTLKDAAQLDPEQAENANDPEFFTEALTKLSNEFPHKLYQLNPGAKSFF